MELEVKGRRPVGRPKKTWSKVVEEDKKLNIREDMAEDIKPWRQLISRPAAGVGNQGQETMTMMIDYDGDNDDD